MKVLYIEDNDVQGDVLKRMLEMLGKHEVRIAPSGQVALQIAYEATWIPDIIITDRRLPNMMGAEIIMALRNETILKNVPIIMLSADMMSKSRTQALEAGANEFFTKPVDYDRLNKCMKELVVQTTT